MCDDTEEAGFLLCVKIPDLQSQTRIVGKQSDTVLAAKQAVLSKLTEVSIPFKKNNAEHLNLDLANKPVHTFISLNYRHGMYLCSLAYESCKWCIGCTDNIHEICCFVKISTCIASK